MKYIIGEIVNNQLILKPIISSDPDKLYKYLSTIYEDFQHIIRKTDKTWSTFEIWEVHWNDGYSKDIVVEQYTVIRLRDLDE